ncbi:MAG TPA: glycosyltransferase [Paracoccaceae bacterium]|nr:glycosyltransferase [Paracoccaceae bacterium]
MTAVPVTQARAIVLGVTADMAFAAGALLAGVRRHDPGMAADVVIFHDGLSDGDRAALAVLAPGVRFRAFTAADALARLGMAAAPPRLAEALARFSALHLAKLELPALLAEYDRVVWLDADMLVRGPLGALWDFDCLAWRPLAPGAVQRRAAVLAACAPRVRDGSVPLLNGGVVGVARGLADRGLGVADLWAEARFLLEATETQTVDEMALWLLAARHGLPVRALPLALNHPVTTGGVDRAVILHAIGAQKFWNATPMLHLYPDWAAHHAEWVAAGGTPWAGPVMLEDQHPAEPAALLKAVQARAFWMDLYDRLRPDLPAGLHPDLRCDGAEWRLFVAGSGQVLRLIRLPNARRIGLVLPTPQARAAVVAAVPEGREGAGGMLTVPLARLPDALRAALG